MRLAVQTKAVRQKNYMSEVLVSEIQRFSIHDGPGIRTTIFLKGCPLRCVWCHNPECISFEVQTLFYPEKCIGCERCADACFAGAKVVCGQRMSVAEVMAQIMQDKPYYGKDGGVTVSGGEPLAHKEFTFELLKACRESGVGTAMESSMYLFDREILSTLDILMADIKVFDNDTHIKYTGISNTEILENIKKADGMGVPMIVRTPIVIGVNDSEENTVATAQFLRALKNVVRYELLPYHPLGTSKAKALGIEYKTFETPSARRMEELRQYADLRR